MKIYGIIYKIENLVNRKVYIGQTIRKFNRRYDGNNIEGVYKYHKRRKNTNNHYNRHLLEAIEKYGFNNFKVIEQFDVAFSKTELDIKERTYIMLYNSIKNGYNNTDGGSNGKPTEEVRKRLSESLKGNKNMLGKHHSEETKNKLREINKGKIFSEETRKKLSENHWNNKGKNHPMYGKHHNDVSKEKNRLAHIGKQMGADNPRAVSVVQLTKENILVKEWDCLADIKRECGFNPSHICNCCKGKRKSHKGYKWMYKTEYIKLNEEA